MFQIVNAVTGAVIVDAECLRRKATEARVDPMSMAQTICRKAKKHAVTARLVIEKV
jgi:hypothetical protein